MRISLQIDVDESTLQGYLATPRQVGELEIATISLDWRLRHSYNMIGRTYHNAGAFVASVGESVSEEIALAVVRHLKALAGEAPLDVADLDLRKVEESGTVDRLLATGEARSPVDRRRDRRRTD